MRVKKFCLKVDSGCVKRWHLKPGGALFIHPFCYMAGNQLLIPCINRYYVNIDLYMGLIVDIQNTQVPKKPFFTDSENFHCWCFLNELSAIVTNNFVTGCGNGYYGPNCANHCGHCANNKCVLTTGVCEPKDCKAGWTGPKCYLSASFLIFKTLKKYLS